MYFTRTQNIQKMGIRTIAPEENCPSVFVVGGNFLRGQLSEQNDPRQILLSRGFV